MELVGLNPKGPCRYMVYTRGSHIPTLRPKYSPFTYMDPLGKVRAQKLPKSLFSTQSSQARYGISKIGASFWEPL